EWKKLKSEELGISSSKISRATRVVLNGLKRKDFDVVTSAELKEVMRTFSRCVIIGRRFPICHVHVGDTIVEVSSFSTQAKRVGKGWFLDPEKPAGCDEKDYVRWRNCLQRDFTINGLMFDPFAKLVYDYLGGVNDIRKAKIRTIKPAILSLSEDCARILRAVRIAARLGFRFSRETATAVTALSQSVMRLDRDRLLMEVNYMFAYGSGEASLRLLWKLGLLEILLPIQAAYFVRHGFRRRDKRYNMLLALFSNLDRFLAPDRPCHSSLWFAVLAFHEALSERPREAKVIAAFSLAIHNGGDLPEAIDIALRIDKRHATGYPEISKPGNLLLHPGALSDEVKSLAASVRTSLNRMTDECFVSRAMAKYPKAPYPAPVFFPLTLYLKGGKVFECVGGVGGGDDVGGKVGSEVDYEMLGMGSLKEVRHVFARIVFDTLYPIH
ncbi:hypothetical protein M569_11807, partial [Genlisea aurea]